MLARGSPIFLKRHCGSALEQFLTRVPAAMERDKFPRAPGRKFCLLLASAGMVGYNLVFVAGMGGMISFFNQVRRAPFMELTFLCPNCGVVNHVRSLEAAGRGICSQCRVGHSLHCELVEDGQLRACPWCATTDLYIQKDFPQGLGLFIVIVGFVISTIFWYLERPLFTYLVLLASALLDMVLYYRVPDVTICYRCLSQIRGAGSNPENRFHPFDLAVGERYRQERLRIEELRKRGGSVEPSSTPLSGPPLKNT